MEKNRLEAFSDGVIAIIITIMVLELKVPHNDSFEALKVLLPIFFSYLLSFIYIGIYWNNHHHMLNVSHKINGNILWGNLHLLFWLSLIPFATNWMGESNFTSIPTAVYGFVLLMSATAYIILQWQIICIDKQDSLLKHAIGSDWKGKISLLLYLIAIPVAFKSPKLSQLIYIFVALIWFLPDSRIEKAIQKKIDAI